MQLGDKIHEALAQVGVTLDRVEQWIGKPCGCEERRVKLNALGSWASRVIGGKVQQAKHYLETLINE